MKRTALKRKTPLPPRKSRIPRVNRQRKSKNWTRAYGSVERVQFVAALPCAVLMCLEAVSENAHIIPGGTGRRADAKYIIPLCTFHHRQIHTIGRASFERAYRINIFEAAERTDAAWRAHLAEDAA
jgi:hypothetical protein